MTALDAAPTLAPLPHRKDIDGLRFFAIVPVVLFHALGDYIPSGFVGVDIFFVISGYLIGGIIYKEASLGKFSFLNFYARRARRILPALFLVIACTILGGLLLLDMEEMRLLAASAQWTLLGAPNIFFFRSIDYFSPNASSNPLLMAWSLGIEEQFYLLFPLVLLSFRFVARRHHFPALMLLNLLSFAAAIYLARAYPLAGFYLLPARAWELGLGAALAMVHLQVAPQDRWRAGSDGLATLGLAMIVASCWLFSEDTPFPGYAALVPVVGTALLLHTADSRINRSVLTAPIFVGIGLVSYSWYLWHWPLMAFVRLSANGLPTPIALLAIALASLLLAYASWRWLEQPMRKAVLPARRALFGYAIALAVVLGVLQVIKFERYFPLSRLPEQVRQIEKVADKGPRCMNAFGDSELSHHPACAPPGATVALFGDSHANHLRLGLRRHVEAQGAQLLQVTKSSCPPLLGFTHKNKLSPNNMVECASFQEKAVKRIVDDPNIRTVVLGWYLSEKHSGSSHVITPEGFDWVPAEVAQTRGIRGMILKLQKAGKHVVVVLDTPRYDMNIFDWTISAAIPLRHQLGALVTADRGPRIVSTRSISNAVKRSISDIPDMTVIDLEDQFCDRKRCVYKADGLPLYVDRHHLSAFGSQRIRWGNFPIR